MEGGGRGVGDEMWGGAGGRVLKELCGVLKELCRIVFLVYFYFLLCFIPYCLLCVGGGWGGVKGALQIFFTCLFLLLLFFLIVDYSLFIHTCHAYRNHTGENCLFFILFVDLFIYLSVYVYLLFLDLFINNFESDV